MHKLAKNLRHLRKMRSMSQEALAIDLDITRARLGSYEESRSEPPLDLLIRLADYFRLPMDIMVKNDLSKSDDNSFIEIGKQRVLFPVTVDEQGGELIEVVPVKASAGYLNGYSDPEYIEQLQKMKLPFIPVGKHRAFPIKGDSMLPVKEGSYIVARFIESDKEMRDGNTYVLLTLNDGVVYKRVYVQGKSLLLVSDNKSYHPYEIKLSEVLEIWEFSCHINTTDYDPEELNLPSIMHMMRELQIELREIKAMKG